MKKVTRNSLLPLAIGLFAFAVFLPGIAGAAGTSTIAIVADDTPPQPSGAPSEYTINFTCSSVAGSTCGASPTIRIPLALTSANPETPPMAGWDYSASSDLAGLVASTEVVGGELVIKLNEAALKPGDSDTIQLQVTPPNGTTPDATAWTLLPSFETSEITSTPALTPALGEASATASLAVTKNTNDGGAVYVSGNEVIFVITARCNGGFPTGSLYLKEGSLVDQLPAGLTFVSATPAPTSAPAVGSSGPIAWEYPTAASLPPGCATGSTGTANYQVVAEIPPSTPNNTSLTNKVTLGGTPIGTTTPLETSAPKTLTAISAPPADPGNFIAKSASGPLNIPGFGFDATYAGHWITPINQAPSTTPGSAEGRYHVTISYPASRAFETDLADPVPCLDNHSGIEYRSLPASGPIEGSGSVPLCANPAFNPTAVMVSSASLPGAIAAGWEPLAITTAGTVIPLELGTGNGGSAYFKIPAANVGNIAAIELPPDANLTDRTMSLDVWGYGDQSLQGGDAMHDVAVATAYPIQTTAPAGTRSQAADIYIEPNQLQLGVYKAFGGLGAGPGGSTVLNLTGGITVPPALALPGPVVLTDLLPAGLSWKNPAASGAFALKKGLGGAGTVTGTVTRIANFEGSGRELIRVSFPAASFTEAGFYSITPPSNFFQLNVPTGAKTYDNTGQLFVAGIGRSTAQVCGYGPGAPGQAAATLESSDPADLDGDGVVEENYCQFGDSLQVPGVGGPAFGLVKLVQGNLDGVPKASPGIGIATPGGTGVYTLEWSNTGGKPLDHPIVYDVLPYVGDTGLTLGQRETPRDSEFATRFVGVGTLPAGVSAEYSTATNPCRPEVIANASNSGCEEDWSASLPASAADVRAVRFVSSATYQPGEAFTVQIEVALPKGEVNTVAWNSAASDAEYSGISLLPAEPPKVGITAELVPVTPTLGTAVSAASVLPDGEVHDTITVGGSAEANGQLEWELLGPVAAVAGGCTAADWSEAPSVDSGGIVTAGDGSYATPSAKLGQLGCYGYQVKLDGSGFTGPVVSPLGSAGEVVLVHPPQSPAPPQPPAPPSPGPQQPGPQPQLTIVKHANRSQVDVGTPVRFTLRVKNVGEAAAHDVVVRDRPRTPMALVSATPSAGSCNGSFPLACGLGTLAPGAVAKVVVVATPLAPGAVLNTAAVGSREGGKQVADARAKGVARVPVSLRKAASARRVEAGGRLGYGIRLRNPAAVAAHHLRVCDRPPAGIAYVRFSLRPSLDEGRYCWSIKTLRAHATRTIRITAKVLAGAHGRLANTAVLRGPEVDPRRARATVRVKPLQVREGGVTG